MLKFRVYNEKKYFTFHARAKFNGKKKIIMILLAKQSMAVLATGFY
jgi:hypothetical protein